MQVAIEHFCPEGLIKCAPVSPRGVTDLTHDWQSCVIYFGPFFEPPDSLSPLVSFAEHGFHVGLGARVLGGTGGSSVSG